MADKVQEGDKVSWNWNGSNPSGKVAEVKAGDVTVTSHRGNDITKSGTEEDPAVHIARSGNDVVKTASELKVEQKGEETKDSPESKKDTTETQNGANGEEANSGDKRKADEDATKEEEKPGQTEKDSKKQKTASGAAAEGKKGPGRPKGANGAKKEKKVPRTGTAQRKTRSQGNAE